jgi:hypothetical protein
VLSRIHDQPTSKAVWLTSNKNEKETASIHTTKMSIRILPVRESKENTYDSAYKKIIAVFESSYGAPYIIAILCAI